MNAPQTIEGATTVPTRVETAQLAYDIACDRSRAPTSSSMLAMERALEAAVQKGIAEQIPPLLEAIERMCRYQSEVAYHEAMSRFRAECPPVFRRQENSNATFSHVNRAGMKVLSMYASDTDITEVIAPVLARHGLSYMFDDRTPPDRAGLSVVMAGIVTHSQGHRQEFGPMTMPIDDRVSGEKGANKPQRVAAGYTNARRELLKMMFGVTPMYEDDGGASFSASEAPVDTITQEQFMAICDLLDSTGRTVEDRKRMKTLYKIEEISQLPASKYEEVIAILSKSNPSPKAVP